MSERITPNFKNRPLVDPHKYGWNGERWVINCKESKFIKPSQYNFFFSRENAFNYYFMLRKNLI